MGELMDYQLLDKLYKEFIMINKNLFPPFKDRRLPYIMSEEDFLKDGVFGMRTKKGTFVTCQQCFDALDDMESYAQDQWNQYMAAPEHQRDPMICVYALQMIVQNCGKIVDK